MDQYFDYAAATPLDPDVQAAMEPFLHQHFYNPSATYEAARASRHYLDLARSDVAAVLGARPSEIIFTAGGTESDNLAIHGVMRQFPNNNIVVSAVEHEAVLAPASRYDCRRVAVAPDGRIKLSELEESIDERTVLVSVVYANNEIGTVQPIREVAQILDRVRQVRRKHVNTTPLYLHTDACQAANYLDLHVSRLGVDLMTLNAGKIYGPKQSGTLYVKGGVRLRPLIDGGGQESGLRSGTEHIAAAVGFARSLVMAQEMRRAESARLADLQTLFFSLSETTIPGIIINGSRHHRLANNVHITIPGTDNERVLIKLDKAGIMAAAGSACSASSDTPSHVLRAIGLSDNEARSSLRFTMGRQTTEAGIRLAVRTLAGCIE